MRTRVFEDGERWASYQGYMTRNGSYLYNYTYSYLAAARREKMEDVVIPNFKKRQKAGEIFQNPRALSRIVVSSVPARMVRVGYENFNPALTLFQDHSFQAVLSSDPSSFHQFSFENSTARYSGWSDLISPAISASWANVSLSEIQILASLGELPETVSWIASIYKRALNLIKLFRAKSLGRAIAKKFKSGSSVVDSLSDVWLEFRYALRPLVFEMHQAVTALDTHVQKASRQTARGFNLDEQESSTVDIIGDPNDIFWSQEEIATVRTNVRAGVLFDISKDINGLLAIWGIDQPLESIWELVPFSFIIDWFFSIGNVISSWSINPSLRPLTSFVTVTELQTFTYLLTNGINGNRTHDWKTFEWTNGYYQASRLITERFPNPARPILPNLNIKLDIGKITDLATIGYKLLSIGTPHKR